AGAGGRVAAAGGAVRRRGAERRAARGRGPKRRSSAWRRRPGRGGDAVEHLGFEELSACSGIGGPSRGHDGAQLGKNRPGWVRGGRDARFFLVM
ncbi:unnamed protein product, partial [Prorocentrum cordatum]